MSLSTTQKSIFSILFASPPRIPRSIGHFLNWVCAARLNKFKARFPVGLDCIFRLQIMIVIFHPKKKWNKHKSRKEVSLPPPLHYSSPFPLTVCVPSSWNHNFKKKKWFFRGLAADYPIQEDYYLYPEVVGPSQSFPKLWLVLLGSKGFPEQFEGLSHTKVELETTKHFHSVFFCFYWWEWTCKRKKKKKSEMRFNFFSFFKASRTGNEISNFWAIEI